jgi:predicted histone-like DNA-binding protein
VESIALQRQEDACWKTGWRLSVDRRMLVGDGLALVGRRADACLKAGVVLGDLDYYVNILNSLIMAVLYRLHKNEIRGSKNFGKYHAMTVKAGTVSQDEIERMIEHRCSATKGDVKLVLTELISVLKERMQEGYVVELEDFGRFSLAVKSVCVDDPEEFDVRKHMKGLKCNFTPAGHRVGMGDRRVRRWFFDGCTIEEAPKYKKPE